jgi:hypothetical protein
LGGGIDTFAEASGRDVNLDEPVIRTSITHLPFIFDHREFKKGGGKYAGIHGALDPLNSEHECRQA